MVALPSARKVKAGGAEHEGRLELGQRSSVTCRLWCAAQSDADRRRRAFPCRTCQGGSDHAPVGFSGRAGERGKADDTCDSGASKVQKAPAHEAHQRDGLINIGCASFAIPLTVKPHLRVPHAAIPRLCRPECCKALSGEPCDLCSAPAREWASPSLDIDFAQHMVLSPGSGARTVFRKSASQMIGRASHLMLEKLKDGICRMSHFSSPSAAALEIQVLSLDA